MSPDSTLVRLSIQTFFSLVLLVVFSGSVLAQSMQRPPAASKNQRLPESLARADIERDSLMNLSRRLHPVSARTLSAARRRAWRRQDLVDRQAVRGAIDHVVRPPLLASMTTAANEADSLALVALYQSTDGFSWTDKTNWLTGPVSTWFGIALDNEGRVTTVDLGSNGLFGALPAQLTNLTELVHLDLSVNFVLGSLPADIDVLTHLELLNLGNNALSGELPESLGNLESLAALVLWGNFLDGPLPASLASLTSLEELWLFDNEFSGEIPAYLGNLTGLTRLYLDQNDFTGPIPSSLGMLENLSELFLDFNQLTGEIPTALSQLANLKVLFLGDNFLEGEIPVEIGDLTSLLVLSLPNNQLTGLIPEALSFFPSLTQLDLGGNALEGEIPLGLEFLYYLTELHLADNQLTGAISESLGQNLANLSELDLSGNQLTGSVPSSLGQLANLSYLDLSGNQLSGALPTFDSGEDLRWVYLNDNQLTGAITEAFDPVFLLQELDLSNNQFMGEIPESMGVHFILQRLILSQNQFTGELPASLDNLTALRVLDLWTNDFSGPLPPRFAAMSALELIDIGSNRFSGELPGDIDQIESIVFLLLDENEFSGALPAAFLELDLLAGLTVKNNRLVDLPDLSGLTALDTLDVSGNRLTFEDLEANVEAAGGAVSYAPQSLVPTRVDEMGNLLRFEVEVGGTANSYRWYLGGQVLEGEEEPVLTLDAAAPGDAAVHAEITNPIAPVLTLQSTPVRQDARLARIDIRPDSMTVAAGDSIQFAFIGYDQFDAPRHFTGVWAASGGVIDETGLFVAGDTSGVYEVSVTDLSGTVRGAALVGIDVVLETDIERDASTRPAFALLAAYPNPFVSHARVAFDLPVPTHVTLRLFDVLGRETAVLVDSSLPAGRHEVALSADTWPAGLYVYTLQAGEFKAARTLIKSR